jgi:hypothetical protein
MTICCLKESGPPSRDNVDDTNLEMPKKSEVLGAPIYVGVKLLRNVEKHI